MGNSEGSSNPFYEAAWHPDNQLVKYTFHSHYDDKFLGRCSILQETDSSDFFLSKEYEFPNEEAYQHRYHELAKMKECLVGTNVLRVKQVVARASDGMIFSGKKIIVIIEHPLTNLEKEFANRSLNNLPFTSHEMISALVSCIKGCAELEKNGFSNNKLRLKHIFVAVQNKESLIKIIEPSLLPALSNFECRSELGEVYLSPEEVEAYRNGEKECDTSKAGVFSLGASMLDMCLMDKSRSIYDIGKTAINENELKNKISIAGKKHGAVVERLLKEMMMMDPKKRASFTELERQIPTLGTICSPTMRYTVIKTGNTVSKPQVYNSRMFTSGIKRDDELLTNHEEEYTNGNQYVGQKKNGQKHGGGKYIFKDGSYYEGAWRNNEMNGQGNFYTRDQFCEYSGEWRNGEYHGWGKVFSQTGPWRQYEGEFIEGKMEGRGRLFFQGGVVYDGEFKGGKITGKGRRIGHGVLIEKQWEPTTIACFADIQ